jgi:hypothetical protein
MKTNFKTLADKFSVLNEQDNKDFISFYGNNETEIKDLNDFETEEELYLSAVIHHTYGRSLLYVNKDYKKAERHLDIARSLILNSKDKFNLELKEDVWYLQTLQHLLKISLHTKSHNKSKEFLRELKLIDSENASEYQLEEKEINRIKKYKFFMILIYCGMGLIAISSISRFLFSTNIGLVGRLGAIVGLVGLIGGYFNKDSVKKDSPQ